MRGNTASSVYLDDVLPPQGVEDVTPPREARATDLSKTFLTLPVVAVIVGTALSISGAQYVMQSGQRDAQAVMQSDIRDMSTRMEYEAKLREKDSLLLEQRFQSLEAKIETAGLRNAAMAMSQDIQKQHTKGNPQ